MQTSYLEHLGIPNQSVCNMASMCPKILGVEQSRAEDIVDFLKGRGLNSKLQGPLTLFESQLLKCSCCSKIAGRSFPSTSTCLTLQRWQPKIWQLSGQQVKQQNAAFSSVARCMLHVCGVD